MALSSFTTCDGALIETWITEAADGDKRVVLFSEPDNPGYPGLMTTLTPEDLDAIIAALQAAREALK